MPETPVGVPVVHKFAFGGGADHRLVVGLAADGTGLTAAVVSSQAEDGAAFVRVHSDVCAEPGESASPVGAAGNLFVLTTSGVGNCGTLCAGGAGTCGVMVVRAGDGAATVPGVVTFNVGDTGGCATVVGGSTSFGAVCEYAAHATPALNTTATSARIRDLFIS
jgi:hypothetical protein